MATLNLTSEAHPSGSPAAHTAVPKAEPHASRYAPHAVNWNRFLWLPLGLSFILLVVPQAGFVWMSFHHATGLGGISEALSLDSYRQIATDRIYIGSILLTLWLSLITTSIGVIVGFPAAYAIARAPRALATALLSIILTTSLITIVVKVVGLDIVLGPFGIVNNALVALSIIDEPIRMLSNSVGVVIGLVQYTLPITMLIFFGTLQTIPRNIEEAAEIHGGSRISIFLKIIVPLASPGILAGALLQFNMCMGAFTSPMLLGGGRVRTLPVLIQQQLIVENNYPMGAALSVVLLVLVFALNVLVGVGTARFFARRKS